MGYKYGKEFELDEMRAGINISKVCNGKAKRKLFFKDRNKSALFKKTILDN